MVKINEERLMDLSLKINNELKKGKGFKSNEFCDGIWNLRKFYEYEIVLESDNETLKITVGAKTNKDGEYDIFWMKMNDELVELKNDYSKDIIKCIVDKFRKYDQNKRNLLIDSVIDKNAINIELDKDELELLIECYKDKKDHAKLYGLIFDKENKLYDKLKKALDSLKETV